MSDWYYATAGGQRHGPLQAAELRTLAASGAIGAQTLVWREGLPQWCALDGMAAELGLPGLPPPPAVPGAASAMPSMPAHAEHVPTNLVWAILSTLFCCWPLGVVAIVYAARVDGRRAAGDIAGAREASRLAGLWSMWSMLSVMIIVVGALLLAALDGAFR